MKKLILLLLLPLWSIAQTSTGQEQEFDYGIKNNSSQFVATPDTLVTKGTDGTYGHTSSYRLPISNDTFDALELKSDKSSTAIKTGCVISAGSGAGLFSVSAGTFMIADNSTGSPVLTPVTFAGATDVSAIYPRTILYITSAGTLVQFNGATGDLSPTQRRQNLFLGGFAFDGVNVLAIQNTPNIDYDISQRFNDLTQTLGVRNQEGNVLTANGANLMINKTSGRTFRHMGNYQIDKNVPDVTTDNAAIPIPSGINLLAYRNGLGGWTYESYSGSLTPTFWDNGTGVKATVANNKFTIPRVYFFNGTDTYIIYLGQKEYGSIDAAIADADRSDRVIDPATSLSSYRGGVVVEKSVTDLQAGIIANTVRFIPPPGGAGAAGGGTVSTQNLQGVYNNSVNPEITTDATRGAFTVRNGQVSDTSNVLEGQNIAGSTTFSVTGAGVLSASNKQNSLAVDGAGVKFPTVDAVNTRYDLNASFSQFEPIKTITSDGTYNAFPSIAKLSNGNLIMVYRKATEHATTGNGYIVYKTSTDNGFSWGAEVTILQDGVSTTDFRDPCIAQLSNGNLIVSYFLHTGVDPFNDFQAYTVISTNLGTSWGTPVALSGYATWSAVSAPVIQLTNGNLLLPTYGKDGANVKTQVHTSTNGGTSWSVLSVLTSQAFTTTTDPYYSEPVLIQTKNGNVLATIRNEVTNYTATAISADLGSTWGSISDRFASLSRCNMNNALTGRVMLTYRTTSASAINATAAFRYTDDYATTISGLETNLFIGGGMDEYSSMANLGNDTFAYVYCVETTSTNSNVLFRYVNPSYSVAPVDSFNANNILNYGDFLQRAKAYFYDNIVANGTLTLNNDLAVNGASIFSGNITLNQPGANGTRYIITNESGSGTGKLIMQAGGGSGSYGGSIIAYGATHATRPGYVTAGLSNASNGKFTVNDDGLGAGTDIFSVDRVTGVVNILDLAGTGDRVVSANSTGNLIISSAPTAPTAALGTNTTQIATTAFVQANKNKLVGYTVATLPAGTIGDMAYVTDASGFSYNSILVGGGSGVTIAFYDGTNWRAH